MLRFFVENPKIHREKILCWRHTLDTATLNFYIVSLIERVNTSNSLRIGIVSNMMIMTLRKVCFFLILASILLSSRADDPVGGIKEEIEEAVEEVYVAGKNLYDKLPPSGKFAAGAGVGFVGSRVAVKSAVSGVKVAGAAFIV